MVLTLGTGAGDRALTIRCGRVGSMVTEEERSP